MNGKRRIKTNLLIMNRTIITIGLSLAFDFSIARATISEIVDKIAPLSKSKNIVILSDERQDSKIFAGLLKEGLAVDEEVVLFEYPEGHSNPCDHYEVCEVAADQMHDHEVIVMVAKHDIQYSLPRQIQYLQADFDLQAREMVFDEFLHEVAI